MKPTLKSALLDPSSFATTLLVAASKLFGPDLVNTWDPTTVRMELADELGQDIPDPNFNKLEAAIQMVSSDVFYRSLPDFIVLCNTLFDGYTSFDAFDPADVGEIAWGITEALLVWPPDPADENPFDDDIIDYIGAALQEEGILSPPDVLKLGTLHSDDLLQQVQYSYSDDPAMFSAIYQVEQAKTDEINQMVASRLQLLIQQLETLPLGSDSAEAIAKKLLAGLRAAAPTG